MYFLVQCCPKISSRFKSSGICNFSCLHYFIFFGNFGSIASYRLGNLHTSGGGEGNQKV